MSDRIKSLTVVLPSGLRDDDAQHIIDAIKMLRGVLEVKANVSDPNHFVAVIQARQAINQRILDALYADYEK